MRNPVFAGLRRFVGRFVGRKILSYAVRQTRVKQHKNATFSYSTCAQNQHFLRLILAAKTRHPVFGRTYDFHSTAWPAMAVLEAPNGHPEELLYCAIFFPPNKAEQTQVPPFLRFTSTERLFQDYTLLAIAATYSVGVSFEPPARLFDPAFQRPSYPASMGALISGKENSGGAA